jgi:hypothetical protein
MLNATMILDFLQQKPGRYIQHDITGLYRMKEADGADVLRTEKKRSGISC